MWHIHHVIHKVEDGQVTPDKESLNPNLCPSIRARDKINYC
jgi:hypothetical protein